MKHFAPTSRLLFAAIIVCGLIGVSIFCRVSSATSTAYSSSIETIGNAEEKSNDAVARTLAAPFKLFKKIFGGNGQNKQKTGKKQFAARNSSIPMPAFSPNEKVYPPSESTHNASPPPARQTPNASDNISPLNEGAAKRAAVKWQPYAEDVPHGDHLSQGNALLERGDLDGAISELSMAATLGPDFAAANSLLGLAFDRRGDHRQAQIYFERSLALAPNDTRTLANYAISLYQSGQQDAALKRLKQASRRAPADLYVRQNLAAVQFALGKYKDAFKTFERAEGAFAAHIHLADLYTNANHDAEALEHYEAARRIDPNSPLVTQRLAALYRRGATLYAQTQPR